MLLVRSCAEAEMGQLPLEIFSKNIWPQNKAQFSVCLLPEVTKVHLESTCDYQNFNKKGKNKYVKCAIVKTSRLQRRMTEKCLWHVLQTIYIPFLCDFSFEFGQRNLDWNDKDYAYNTIAFKKWFDRRYWHGLANSLPLKSNADSLNSELLGRLQSFCL